MIAPMSHQSFLQEFTEIFAQDPFRDLARKTKWQQRKGKIDPFEFLSSAILGQASAARMTLVAHGQAFSDPVTRQAIDQRFTPQAVEFFKASFSHCLGQTLDWVPSQPQALLLKEHFAAVHLLDSTAFDCPDSLKDVFPGCGGDASAANLKVLTRYDLIGGCLQPMALLPGKRSDQGLAVFAAESLRANELQLQDKGFFCARAFEVARQNKAFLLGPIPNSVTLWQAGADGSLEALDLAAVLAATTQNQVQYTEVFTGKGAHRTGPLRIVAFRLSPKSSERRRAALREACRRQGRTPKARALQLADWQILVTNAPEEKLPAGVISYLYRARWQVELIFRSLKTLLRLDQTRSENPNRVQCEIWARLTLGIVLFVLHAHANAQSWSQKQSEVSFEKLFSIAQHWGLTLARALIRGSEFLLQELRSMWRQLMVNAIKGRQKSRTNTWDNLSEHWLASTDKIKSI
jgi:Transposase DDE domain